MKAIKVEVIQKPVVVEWYCESCSHINKEPYDEFLGGEEQCDWMYNEVTCEACGEVFFIEYVDWL